MKIVRLISHLGIVIPLLISCTSQKELMYLSNIDTSSIQQFFPMERPEYKIQYQDILYINISTLDPDMNLLLNPDLQRSSVASFREESSIYIFGYTVSDSGTITLPMLGEIKVYGLSIDEIHSKIQNRANMLLKDAIVNVKLISFKFTVIGEVKKPGTYTNFNNQLTVLEAIGIAGDITDFGNRQKILVLRPSKNGTLTYEVNVQDTSLLHTQGYFLLPNDIVIVEPIKSKPFRLNIPTISLALSSISTLVFVLTFILTN